MVTVIAQAALLAISVALLTCSVLSIRNKIHLRTLHVLGCVLLMAEVAASWIIGEAVFIVLFTTALVLWAGVFALLVFFLRRAQYASTTHAHHDDAPEK